MTEKQPFNKAAARERRDCALVPTEDHRRGVGEPRRWTNEHTT